MLAATSLSITLAQNNLPPININISLGGQNSSSSTIPNNEPQTTTTPEPDYLEYVYEMGGDPEPIDNPVSSPVKFQKWWPAMERIYRVASEDACNATLAAYLGDRTIRTSLGDVDSFCDIHVNCMLANMPEKIKASMGAASVVLGLIPGFLASLGPTLAEISLLSLRRPALAALLSIGSPGIYPSRFGGYQDPCEALRPQVGDIALSPFRRRYAVLFSACEYILAAAAVTNTLLVSWRIGTWGVSIWACRYSHLVICWAVLPAVVHIIAAIGLRIVLWRSRAREGKTTELLGGDSHAQQAQYQKSEDEKTELKADASGELKISANANPTDRHLSLRSPTVGPLAVAINMFAQGVGLLSVIFGSLLLPTYLFIGVVDATQIMFQFIGSSVVCKMILYFEMGGIVRVDEDVPVRNGIVQGKPTLARRDIVDIVIEHTESRGQLRPEQANC